MGVANGAELIKFKEVSGHIFGCDNLNFVSLGWSGGGGSNQGDWGSFGDGYQGNWDTGGQDGHYKGGKTYGGHQRGGGRGGRGGQYHRQNSGQIYYS